VEVEYLPIDPDLEDAGDITYVDMAVKAVDGLREKNGMGTFSCSCLLRRTSWRPASALKVAGIRARRSFPSLRGFRPPSRDGSTR